MPFNLSVGEILVLLVVAIILFGGRLPQVARQIGLTIGNFKRGMSAEMGRLDRDLRTDLDVDRDILYTPAERIEPAGPAPGQECEEESDPTPAEEEPRKDPPASSE